MDQTRRRDGLSPETLARLLSLEDGAAALTYLHALHKGQPWPDAVPGLSRDELAGARRKLAQAGLLSPPVAPQSPSGPRYEGRSIAGVLLTDPDFSHVAKQTEKILGRALSPSDLRILYSFYDFRGFPPGVILLLLHYCVDEFARKHGPGRVPVMSQIDREAALWQEWELFTEKAAEAFVRKREEERRAAAGAYRAVGIFSRAPSATEQKYVAVWTELGFGPEMIALAYDKTVLATGRLVWKYCDAILRRWHEAGFKTPEDVERGDRKPGKGEPKSEPESSPAVDNTRAVLARMKGEGA